MTDDMWDIVIDVHLRGTYLTVKAAYNQMLEQNTGGSRSEVLEMAGKFADPIADFDAEILREIEGIAAGADLPLEEVLLINARYELMIATVFDNDSSGSPGECTSLAAADELARLARLTVDRNVLMDCQQIAHGTYSPLTGFMTQDMLASVLRDNCVLEGDAWTLPIVLQVDAAREGEALAVVKAFEFGCRYATFRSVATSVSDHCA